MRKVLLVPILLAATPTVHAQNMLTYGDFEAISGCTQVFSAAPSTGQGCFDQLRWPNCGSTWWGYQRQSNGAFLTSGQTGSIIDASTANGNPPSKPVGPTMFKVNLAPTPGNDRAFVLYQRLPSGSWLQPGRTYQISWNYAFFVSGASVTSYTTVVHGNGWSCNTPIAQADMFNDYPCLPPARNAIGAFDPFPTPRAMSSDSKVFTIPAGASPQEFIGLRVDARRISGTSSTSFYLDDIVLVDITTTMAPEPMGAADANKRWDATVAPHLRVAPNPVFDMLELFTSDLSSDAVIEVIAADGRIVHSFNGTVGSRQMIDMSREKAGLYSIKLVDRGATEVLRVVKE
jgi:hypothetical protein